MVHFDKSRVEKAAYSLRRGRAHPAFEKYFCGTWKMKRTFNSTRYVMPSLLTAVQLLLSSFLRRNRLIKSSRVCLLTSCSQAQTFRLFFFNSIFFCSLVAILTLQHFYSLYKDLFLYILLNFLCIHAVLQKYPTSRRRKLYKRYIQLGKFVFLLRSEPEKFSFPSLLWPFGIFILGSLNAFMKHEREWQDKAWMCNRCNIKVWVNITLMSHASPKCLTGTRTWQLCTHPNGLYLNSASTHWCN